MDQQTQRSGGNGATAVQGQSGGALAVNQIKSIQTKDGWHDVENVELSYTDQNGTQRTAKFTELRGFSDTPREP